MWTPWKVSTFLAWEEEDYSLKTLAPLSKASGSNQADAIPRSSRLPTAVDWGKMDGRDCTEEEGEEDWGEGEGFEEEKGEKLKWPSSKETKFDWKKKEKEVVIADISPSISFVFPIFFFYSHTVILAHSNCLHLLKGKAVETHLWTMDELLSVILSSSIPSTESGKDRKKAR